MLFVSLLAFHFYLGPINDLCYAFVGFIAKSTFVYFYNFLNIFDRFVFLLSFDFFVNPC